MFLAVPAWAGRVHLKSGGVAEGVVVQTADTVTVTRGSLVMSYANGDILRIEDVVTPWDSLNGQLRTLDRGSREQLFAIVDTVRQHELDYDLEPIYRAILALEPDNPEANRALRRIRLNGRWMELEEYLMATGLVRDEQGEWIAREEAAARRAYAMHLEQRDRFKRELIDRLVQELASDDRQRISAAQNEVSEWEREYPGLQTEVSRDLDVWKWANTPLPKVRIGIQEDRTVVGGALPVRAAGQDDYIRETMRIGEGGYVILGGSGSSSSSESSSGIPFLGGLPGLGSKSRSSSSGVSTVITRATVIDFEEEMWRQMNER